MATLAEIRAKLQEQESSGGRGSQTGGDNAIFPFWNIPENSTSVLRFLPDGDSSNTYFWRERQMIRLEFAGVQGQADSRKVTVNVPCNEMWGPTGSCPVLAEVRPWFKDPALEDMGRKYWKKRSYVMQGFVRENPIADDKSEQPIRRFIIGPQIFQIIKSALMDPELEELPTDYSRGLDFRVSKTSKGGYADYSTSKWSRRERALDEHERAAIDKNGLHNLSDFRPKEPTEAEVKIIKELFEKSVDGEAYDLEKYGQYFRPAGISASQVSVPTADRPAPVERTADPVNAEVKETAPAPQPETTAEQPAPAATTTDSAKRAEDILKLIRSRQAK